MLGWHNSPVDAIEFRENAVTNHNVDSSEELTTRYM